MLEGTYQSTRPYVSNSFRRYASPRSCDGDVVLTQQNRRFLLALLSIFQPIGVVITAALAYAFIPSNSCKPDFTTDDPLPSCRLVSPGTPCCSKSKNMGYRYLLYTLGAITLFVFFLRFVVFRFQESPNTFCIGGRMRRLCRCCIILRSSIAGSAISQWPRSSAWNANTIPSARPEAARGRCLEVARSSCRPTTRRSCLQSSVDTRCSSMAGRWRD